jgi:peptidoglycan/LPS O-acetylase OafA/YrhL
MRRTHLPERNLDVLRAIAVLLVVVDHVLWVAGINSSTVPDWDFGRIGVLLFFIHTSLVLMSSLERSSERRHWVRDFYIRRAFRIYPLAIAAILLTVLLGIPTKVEVAFIPPTLRTLATNLLLIQNITGNRDTMGMLWTLPIEVQMYVILPALFLLARRSVSGIAGMFGLTALLALAVQYAPVPGLWRLTVATFGPCFVSGVLAYAILRNGPRKTLPAWTWPLLLVAAAPIFLLLNPSPDHAESGWFFCLAVGLVLPFVAELRESAVTRVAHTICTYSYGIYLLLTPAIWIGVDVLRSEPRTVQWVAVAVALVALPWAAYTFIEHPAIVLGRNIVSGKPTLAATAPAP